jgi:UDP-hydrolysing UDP-N-acetyl-D-glucosamine 2-epimerase
MRKIAVFVGSRANWGRLKSVCKAITEHEALELQLILGASFYNAKVEYPVASRIQCLISSDDHEGMSLTTGILLSKVSAELQRLAPDIVLVHGDRYEVLAVAQAAAYQNIPLAHTEGGEVTGCIDDKVRNAITALADIHFPVTDRANGWIQGLRNDFKYVIKTVGSTALDGIKHVRNIEATPQDNRNIVILYHPETSNEEDYEQLISAVNLFQQKEQCDVIWINPNVDAGSVQILKRLHETQWNFMKKLNPEEYASWIKHSSCLVGNSSSFIKEGSFLGVPAVLVGNRQKGREMDKNCICVPMDEAAIYKAISEQYGKQYEPSNYFGDGTASTKIANILAEVAL